jgi:hypothetical protein
MAAPIGVAIFVLLMFEIMHISMINDYQRCQVWSNLYSVPRFRYSDLA